MADLEAPSFSLGLDDLDQEADALASEELHPYRVTISPHSTNPIVRNLNDHEPQKRSRHVSSFNPASSSSLFTSVDFDDGDTAFERESISATVNLDDDTVPVLKRLRRGPKAPSSSEAKQHVLEIPSGSEDEIEEFSPQQDLFTGDGSATQNLSAFGSSKTPLNMCGILRKPKSEKNEVKHRPSVSGSSGLERGTSRLTFPSLSPVRKFELLDSDSDDYFISGIVTKSTPHNEFNKRDNLHNTPQTKNPFNEFSPMHCGSIPTPALDKVCEEYFGGASKRTANKNADIGVSLNKAEGYDSVPPSHRYFFHENPSVRELVHTRLPYFRPLGDTNSMKIHPFDTQFNHNDQIQANCNVEKRNKMQCRKLTSETPSSWVDPKRDSSSVATNAGKRRVHAYCGSSYWVTDNGRKTYVDKSGQKLNGKDAYIQYKKESGQKLAGRDACVQYKKGKGTRFKKGKKRKAGKKQ